MTSFRTLRLCLLIWLSCLAGFAHSADEISLTPLQVSPHVWMFQGESGMATASNKGYMSNAGFVVTQQGVVVFDALGSPALGQAMVTAIRRVTPQPIKTVIVSHYHADHYYGLQALKAAGAEIWAHANVLKVVSAQGALSDEAKNRLAQRKADLFPWVDDSTRLLPPDRTFAFERANDFPFSLGEVNFRLINVAGAHSPEDLMLMVETDRTLFAGDLFFTGRIPFVGNADSKAWLAALQRITAQQATTVIPGHGAASKNVTEDLNLTRDYLTYLRSQMALAVQDLKSFDDAYAGIDWSRYEKMPAFAAGNRLNAYGVFIQMEQESLNPTGGGASSPKPDDHSGHQH